MNEYKNQISILRNILQKSNDQNLIDYVFKKNLPEIFDFYRFDLIDYVFKKNLPEIFDFYSENYIIPNIIYNIDSCY